MPCSVLYCRRPQLEYFQSVGDFAPSFAHASRTSQVQVYVFAGAICIFISFTMPAIPAESAKMQKLHLCTFAYSFCANHAILFTHASHTSRKRKNALLHFCMFDLRQPHHPFFAHASRTSRECKNANALLHILLAPATTSLLCPCQPYQKKWKSAKFVFLHMLAFLQFCIASCASSPS